MSYEAPLSDTHNWPRIVTIAWICTDRNLVPLAKRYAVITPDGFAIPAEASRIHGITQQYALEHGVPDRKSVV